MSPVEVGVVCVLLNIVLWLSIYTTQEIEVLYHKIPARSPGFRHFQEWHTTTLGDWVGLSLLNFALGYTIAMQGVEWTIFLLALAVGVWGAQIAHTQFSSVRHVPDAGYPQPGRISFSGRLHIGYFFLQSATAAYLLLLALGGALHGLALGASLIGGAIYLFSYGFDYNKGRFFKKLPFMH